MKHTLKRQSGLTLVELMVATTLSLVLLAGVLLVFSANKSTYQMQNGLGTLQENGRYAMGQIMADLQLAGFGGCLSPQVRDGQSRAQKAVIRNLVSSPPSFLNDFTAGRFFDGRNDQSGTFTYGGVTMVPGTDSVEIRGPLRSNVNFVVGEVGKTSTVDVVGTASGFATNEFLLVADCGGADIFRATGVATSGGNTQISHSSASNTQAELSRNYGSDAVVMEFATHTYFIGETGRNNSSGQAVTALYRFDGNSSQELVDGVDDLQIEYALDTDGDGVIDGFDDASGVTDWADVHGLRFSLLMNSVDGASAVEASYTYFPSGTVPIVPTTGDLRLRQEFSTQVSIRNSVL